MIPARVIEAKRDGAELATDTLRAFLRQYRDGTVPDYQMSALLMAIVFRGLTDRETGVMVDAMVGSGATLDFSHLERVKVDKHSTGGVGDKVSLVLAPLAAELGMYVPMMSGRGLGHTTGTLDKLEAIPGFRVDLDLARFGAVLERVGCAMTGQTEEIAPLDRRLYALRDVSGTVPSIPLIAASIMSKKLAEGLDGLVLDVKVGEGAFLPEREQALELARTMVRIGVDRGLRTVALLTAMDRPLGVAVGNGLETAEAVRCLKDEGPQDLRRLVLTLAAEMAHMADPSASGEAVTRRAEDALSSGRAFERFERLVAEQGGDMECLADPERLHTAAERAEVRAGRSGTVHRVRPRGLGEAVVALGGGRTTVDSSIDPGVGFEVFVRPGDDVGEDTVIGCVHARNADGLNVGRRALHESVVLGDGPGPDPLPLVVERVVAAA
ncbi:MAG: thymidine phosphorylase [Gemmatimonadota bacterium]|nr:thymidine phosphorylase [Gemmatimonadota bacterium]